MVLSLTMFLLFRIILEVLGFLCFHMNLEELSVSVKDHIRTLMGSVIILYVVLVGWSFTAPVLPVHGHGRSFHLLTSYLTHFFRILKFLL